MFTNYGGKQPNQTAYIKTFFPGAPAPLWYVDNIYNTNLLTPYPPYQDIYIPNNIFVNGNAMITSQYVHSSFELTVTDTLYVLSPFYEIYPLAPNAQNGHSH